MDFPKPTIVELLAKAASRVGAIGKDSLNQQQGFKFRGIDAVLRHVHPIFAELGIVVTPDVVARDVETVLVGKDQRPWRLVSLTVSYRFNGPAGDVLEAVTVGEGFDPGDKAANKAMSAAFKYALVQVLTIPDADIEEADSQAYPEPSAQQRSRRQAPKPPAPPSTGPGASPPSLPGPVADILEPLNGIGDAELRARVKKEWVTEFGQPAGLDTSRYMEATQWVDAKMSELESA